MTRAWTRSCAACSVRKALIFLMLCNAKLQDWAVFAMWYLKVSCSSMITPRFLTELDGVIVEENLAGWGNYAVEWQGRQEAQFLPGWAVGDVLSSMPRCPPGSLRSKKWPQRNPSDQLMCFGYLPSLGHLERPTSEIGFKPAKWNPCDVQWWEGGQEDLIWIDIVVSSR